MCEGCFRGGGSFQGNRLLPPHWLYPSSVMNLGKVYGLKTGSERRRLFTKTCVSYQSLLISLGVSPGIVAREKRQRVTGSFAAGCGWIIPAILSRLKLHFFQRIGSILHLFCQILHSNHLCGKKRRCFKSPTSSCWNWHLRLDYCRRVRAFICFEACSCSLL